MVTADRDGPPPPAVINQGINCFLEHSLLVADDNRGRLYFQQVTQAVIAVDDPTVEVVKIAGGEAAAVQLHHGPQVGRQHGQHGENHPLRLIAAAAEGLHHLQLLGRLAAALPRSGACLIKQLVAQFVKVDVLEELQDSLGAHVGVKDRLKLLIKVEVLALGEQGVLAQVP